MKKVLFGIFAHPDDEAFGPCGTLVKFVHEGADLHLFSLTLGDAGQNPDYVSNLGEVREAEWRTAGERIGATSMQTLCLSDGKLDNITMQAINNQIIPAIKSIIDTYDEPIEAIVITLDPNGLTGHIDHIVAARSASFVFHRLKSEGLPMSKVLYYCHSNTKKPSINTDWIYADIGRTEAEIGETIDAREYREKIIEVMRSHHSQRGDYEYVLNAQGDDLGLDHFMVRV